MYCGECGAYNNEGSDFCLNCSATLTVDSAEDTKIDSFDTQPSVVDFEKKGTIKNEEVSDSSEKISTTEKMLSPKDENSPKTESIEQESVKKNNPLREESSESKKPESIEENSLEKNKPLHEDLSKDQKALGEKKQILSEGENFRAEEKKRESVEKKSQEESSFSPESDFTHISLIRKNPTTINFSKYTKNPLNFDSDKKDAKNLKKKFSSQSTKNLLKIGSVFANRYRVEKLIGKGGMGQVYKVYDSSLEESKALKVLYPILAEQKEILQRFKHEAQIISQMTHINLVRFVSFEQFEKFFYIVMEYIDGISLRVWMRERAKLADIDEVFDIIIQLSQALKEVHKYTVHRDIKPENILLSKTGCVKLMDFGIAKIKKEESFFENNTSMGTAYYMSPEQMVNPQNVDPRADIFSLGVILYEMIYFKIPTGHFKVSVIKDRHISESLVVTIKKALESERNERFQLVEEFLILIEEEREKIKKTRLGKKRLLFQSKKTSFFQKFSSNIFLLLSLSLILGVFFVFLYFSYLMVNLKTSPQQTYNPNRLKDLFSQDRTKFPRTKYVRYVEGKKSKIKFAFIPEQIFTRGDIFKNGDQDELPLKKIHVDAFYMGRYEVSNREYALFVSESLHPAPVNVLGKDSKYTIWSDGHVPEELLDYPVVNVSWDDACAFCRWLCDYENVPQGTYRLPTEAEWEVAARGGKSYIYPWGNSPPDFEKANFNKIWLGPFSMSKVGAYPPNPYGLYDMAGNVWEWCLDVYLKNYYKNAHKENPYARGTGISNQNVLRGGGVE